MAQFEGYERREAKILGVLKNYGISSIDECKDICAKYGVDPYTTVQETQPICFENAKWAYTVGSAIAFKEAERTGDKSAATAAAGASKPEGAVQASSEPWFREHIYKKLNEKLAQFCAEKEKKQG